jgi:methyl-accepting chemotaxis protein
MFRNLKLTTKISGCIAIALVVTGVVGFFITQRRINQQAEEAFVDKLRKTDGMASNMRTFFSANVDIYAPHHEFKNIKQVPVVVAWSVARQYAESQGMKFTTPSLHPRDAVNAPTEFEARALHAFEADPALKVFYSRLNLNGTEVISYAQPVRLTIASFATETPPGLKTLSVLPRRV